MRILPLSAALVAAGALAACGMAGYPDRGPVESAQRSWCDALAKVSGQGASWEHLSACKATYPTASAPYLRGMAKCFPAQKESYGGKAPDTGHLIAQCNDEVLAKMSVDDGTFAEAIDARCERANRCEKVPIPDCVAAVKKLETSQRAIFYGQYNGAALHTVSECLKSSACDADEDGARANCYKLVDGKMLWLPN
jgi:hypothetical protein